MANGAWLALVGWSLLLNSKDFLRIGFRGRFTFVPFTVALGEVATGNRKGALVVAELVSIVPEGWGNVPRPLSFYPANADAP